MDLSSPASASAGTLGGEHRPLRQLVRDELRRMVITGELAPGSRLVEDRLAESLGVSRNPVREALQALAGEGFVELSPRRGAVVARVTREQAEDLFDVRMSLESLAARLAARRVHPEDVLRLGEVLEQARRANDEGDLDRVAALNNTFHTAVVAMSGNDYLALLMAPLSRRVQWVFRMSAAERGPHSWHEHEGLVAAIVAGDEDLAEALAVAHVRAARASYLALAAA